MLVNKTPHAIHVVDADGDVIRIIEPTLPAARVSVTNSVIGEYDGVILVRATFGEVVDLPNSAPDTMYIVSMLVRQALPGRTDLCSPNDLLRDNAGVIIGAKNFAVS